MCLARDGAGNSRFGMAKQIGPPAADSVQVAASVVAMQPGPLATSYWHQGQGVRMFAHLGAWMPQHAQIAFPPFMGLIHGFANIGNLPSGRPP
jgi:hypothetical protein